MNILSHRFLWHFSHYYYYYYYYYYWSSINVISYLLSLNKW
ncbi:MAG: hypothetical protein N7Q72_01490 [Spiroplasma sp. Tabriz.8]|nr:hypothetical protein [Spiroplasma sp. Tabriz.8]